MMKICAMKYANRQTKIGVRPTVGRPTRGAGQPGLAYGRMDAAQRGHRPSAQLARARVHDPSPCTGKRTAQVGHARRIAQAQAIISAGAMCGGCFHGVYMHSARRPSSFMGLKVCLTPGGTQISI